MIGEIIAVIIGIAIVVIVTIKMKQNSGRYEY